MSTTLLQQALEALKENHQWHQDYDEHGSYPDSVLCVQNTKAIADLEAASTPEPTASAAGERDSWTYRHNILTGVANWLEGRSSTVWAKEFRHTALMLTWAADLRRIDAALASKPPQGEPPSEAGFVAFQNGRPHSFSFNTLPDGKHTLYTAQHSGGVPAGFVAGEYLHKFMGKGEGIVRRFYNGEDQSVVDAGAWIQEANQLFQVLAASPSPSAVQPLREVQKREPWLCLLCKSDRPGHHGTLDDRVTPCPSAHGIVTKDGP